KEDTGRSNPRREDTSGHGRGRCREPSTIPPLRRQDRQQPGPRPRQLAKSRLPRRGADAVLPIRPAAAWKSAAYGWKQSLFGPYPFHRQPRSDYLSALLRTPALNLVQPRLGRTQLLNCARVVYSGRLSAAARYSAGMASERGSPDTASAPPRPIPNRR